MTKDFDVIIIGAGMTGSFAAKEFCDRGYKTLLLERGREVVHNVDYPTTNTTPWQDTSRGLTDAKLLEDNPINARCYAFNQQTEHFFAKDSHHPYQQVKPFDWIRGYQVGGKSLLWARQVQRWSNFDFEGPKRDGFAIDWPIRYEDIEKWYTYVEGFIGVSGNKDNLDSLPDGDFLPPFSLNCVEEHFKKTLQDAYDDRQLIHGRCAHITEMRDVFKQQGRTLCQNRTICERGCPFGGYFSANSTLIPWAKRTGNLTLRPHSLVRSIDHDPINKVAKGVTIIDANTKEETTYTSRVVFVNASTLNTNLVLLNSKSERFPNGLGNDSGLLGTHVAFHNYRGRISAKYFGHKDVRDDGRKPTGSLIPRFRNLQKNNMPFKRGYAAYFFASKNKKYTTEGFGPDLKSQLDNPQYDHWDIYCGMMGETIPKLENKVWLDSTKKDEWGIPILSIDIGYDDNDEAMVKDFLQEMSDMMIKAGCTDIEAVDNQQAPGNDIHEMGGVRMGDDPAKSMLNKWNQMHEVSNVFVTDGACMTSTSTQNPSLTFMALTTRAANYADTLMKEGRL